MYKDGFESIMVSPDPFASLSQVDSIYWYTPYPDPSLPDRTRLAPTLFTSAFCFFHEVGQWANIHSKCLSLFKLSTPSLNYFAIGWFHFHVRDTFDLDAYECCVGIHAVTSVHAREWLVCLSADALVQFTSFVRNCYACTLRLSKNTPNLAVLYNFLTQ